jgi:tRNA nucleotidyltransferase (CCA-adding enzyme)
MKRYLVGGVVRDRLLGMEVKDHDWLVTDTTPEQLLQNGYIQVGRDFPVFLHPKTKEEHALPRSDRNDTGNRTATLEQDLERRDLTINAMAMDENGEIIDPCSGQQDIKDRLLRHTPAFREDPIRVLRLARFAARLHELGFKVADETRNLVQEMVLNRELDHLVPERCFGELHKALTEKRPDVFFRELRASGALRAVIPELDKLFGVPQPEQHHPEIDSGIHSLLTLKQAARLSDDPQVRYAAIMHDLGKGATPQAEWPRHIGHEQRGVPLVNIVSRKLGVPNEWNRLAKHVARHHLDCHRALELRPQTILKLLQNLDALRQPDRFERFLTACHADLLGRPGREREKYPQADLFRKARDAALNIDASALTKDMRDGKEIAAKLQRERTQAIKQAKQNFKLG